MYKVSVRLIVSGKGFHPGTELVRSRYLHRIWNEGELVLPKATKRFEDAGVAYRVLNEYEDEDWADAVLEPMRELAGQIRTAGSTTKLPTPQVSIFIETNGEGYPPIFLSRELLALVTMMEGEVDVDIVNSL